MGRTYDVNPKAGERGGRRLTVRSASGTIQRVTRVEFDHDADYGPATVTAYLVCENGELLFSPDREPVKVSFRANVSVEPKKKRAFRPTGAAETPMSSTPKDSADLPGGFAVPGAQFLPTPGTVRWQSPEFDGERFGAKGETAPLPPADVKPWTGNFVYGPPGDSLSDPAPTVVMGGR